MYKPNIVKRYEGEEWEVLLHDQDGYLFMHCNFNDDMKLSTLRSLRKIMTKMLEWADSEYYDGIHAVTENKRFAEMIPYGKHIEDIEYKGRGMGIYKWELK